MIRWGDREGTEEEYLAWLEEERERGERELGPMIEKLKGALRAGGNVDAAAALLGGGGGSVGAGLERGRKGKQRVLYLSDETWEALNSIAVETGFVRAGRGNVSALIDAWVWNRLPLT